MATTVLINTTRLCWNAGTDICIEEVCLTKCTMHNKMRHTSVHIEKHDQVQDMTAKRLETVWFDLFRRSFTHSSSYLRCCFVWGKRFHEHSIKSKLKTYKPRQNLLVSSQSAITINKATACCIISLKMHFKLSKNPWEQSLIWTMWHTVCVKVYKTYLLSNLTVLRNLQPVQN